MSLLSTDFRPWNYPDPALLNFFCRMLKMQNFENTLRQNFECFPGLQLVYDSVLIRWLNTICVTDSCELLQSSWKIYPWLTWWYLYLQVKKNNCKFCRYFKLESKTIPYLNVMFNKRNCVLILNLYFAVAIILFYIMPNQWSQYSSACSYYGKHVLWDVFSPPTYSSWACGSNEHWKPTWPPCRPQRVTTSGCQDGPVAPRYPRSVELVCAKGCMIRAKRQVRPRSCLRT